MKIIPRALAAPPGATCIIHYLHLFAAFNYNEWNGVNWEYKGKQSSCRQTQKRLIGTKRFDWILDACGWNYANELPPTKKLFLVTRVVLLEMYPEFPRPSPPSQRETALDALAYQAWAFVRQCQTIISIKDQIDVPRGAGLRVIL